MTDRFDEAKRALEGVAANDVWAEAERRAAEGTVVPLPAAAGGGGRLRGRWLAGVAAVAVLAVGTVAVLANDDEAPVDTVPSTDGVDDPGAAAVAIYRAGSGCTVGIVGEPPLDPQVTLPADEVSEGSTVLIGELNPAQSYVIRVPGMVVTDLVGERVEDLELQRGTAQIWFSDDFVQVRWFAGTQDDCESFTVDVHGGTEDENRHAAVDLAERVLIADELDLDDPTHATPRGNPLAGSEWQLERSTIDGVSTEGGGSTFMFTGREVEWSDGCNAWTAPYGYADDAITLDSGTGDEISCDGNPTSDAVRAVMTGGPVSVTFEGDVLELRVGGAKLTLRPLVHDTDPVGSDTTLSPTTSTVPASTTTTIP